MLPPPFFCHVERSEISPTNSKINKQKKQKSIKPPHLQKKKTKIQLFYARICTSFTLDFKEIVCQYYNET